MVADYFGITVNALNARLRTCTDRLRSFPDFIGYGTNIMSAIANLRPEFSNKVHPIWELSRRLLQSHTDGVLAAELIGFEENGGIIFDFMAKSEFLVDGLMPTMRPEDSMLELPSGRKRKHDGVFTSPSRHPSPTISANLPEVKAVTIPGPVVKRQRSNADNDIDGLIAENSLIPQESQAEKSQGRGSRSEPYTRHELCCIFIARRIRMLDWDSISWSLSRFRTPTVTMLAEARTLFDPYLEQIIETLRLCCWPEDSMYLIACAADECLAAIDRANWSEEIKQFKVNRGYLHQQYMQRRVERLYRKSTESPEEKRLRRKRERKFGYEWLSVEDFNRIPLRKRVGALASAESNKPRKRRTKEEIQEQAAEKAAARALLKANGLKANGEAKYERKKLAMEKQLQTEAKVQAGLSIKSTDTETETATVNTLDTSIHTNMHQKQSQPSSNHSGNLDGCSDKKPRRKYDIPEIERNAFPVKHEEPRRLKYTLTTDERDFASRVKHGIDNSHDQHHRPNHDNADNLNASGRQSNGRSPSNGQASLTFNEHTPLGLFKGTSSAGPMSIEQRASDQTYGGRRDRDILNASNKSPIRHTSHSYSSQNDSTFMDTYTTSLSTPEKLRFRDDRSRTFPHSPSQYPGIPSLLLGSARPTLSPLGQSYKSHDFNQDHKYEPAHHYLQTHNHHNLMKPGQSNLGSFESAVASVNTSSTNSHSFISYTNTNNNNNNSHNAGDNANHKNHDAFMAQAHRMSSASVQYPSPPFPTSYDGRKNEQDETLRAPPVRHGMSLSSLLN